MSTRIDECGAAQLWIEVRTFAWQHRRKVAANIVMILRRGVLRELGAVEHVRAVDPTWARALPLAPEAALWRAIDAKAAEPAGLEPQDELADLLGWGTSQRVIDMDRRAPDSQWPSPLRSASRSLSALPRSSPQSSRSTRPARS